MALSTNAHVRSFFISLILVVLIERTRGYAAWLPCYVELADDEVVMNQFIVPAKKASTVLNLQVRSQGTEEWTIASSEALSVKANTIYEASFYLPDEIMEGLETLEFVMEVSEGGSFAADKTGKCQSLRAHGKGDRIVNFTVDGTREQVMLTGAWALGHAAVSLTPATLLRLDAAATGPEQEL